MGMGYLPYWMMYQCLMATFLFYLAHWQTYVTGKYCSVHYFIYIVQVYDYKRNIVNICL